MKVDNKFNWLHISDFHQGMKGTENLWHDVKSSFYEDITYHCLAQGNLDVVVFSGDLTQQGTEAEFNAVIKEIVTLWEHFKTAGQNPSLFLIPGNHDFERPKPHSPVALALQGWKSEGMTEAFYQKDGPYLTQVNEMFKNYSQFIKKLKTRKIKILEEGIGVMPGDSCGVWQKDEFRVGLVGLNTAWSQITSGDLQGKLQLSSTQIHQVSKEHISEWTNANHVNLIVTHHPVNWLSSDSEHIFDVEINPLGRFTAHLFGHMHEAKAVQEDYGDEEMKRSFQASSLFGLETYGQNKKRSHGYNFGQINFDDDAVTWWPKKAEQRVGAGGWTIRPDTGSLPKRQNECITYKVKINNKKKT